jgi:glycosyltransferase involved in cell wall biosynthesis
METNVDLTSIPVSIIIPCRDEYDHIDVCLTSVSSQKYPGPIEFIVAEGCSEDDTRAKLVDWATRDSRIVIVDNPEGIVPTGLNRAIEVASGDVIIRIDVHTRYDSNYIVNCVKTLTESHAANVGGAWRAEGFGFKQRIIALAFRSWFSSGGALSHNTEYEGFVDSVYLGCWYKKTLVDVGLFDEELVRNQDDELNLRLIRCGQKVWQSASIISYYRPRTSVVSLFRQYFQYGYWKIRVMQKHRIPASFRHVAPGLALFSGAALLSASFFNDWPLVLLLVLAFTYSAVSFAVSLAIGIRERSLSVALVLPSIFATFHLAYGAGSLKGILDFWLLRRGADTRMARITR